MRTTNTPRVVALVVTLSIALATGGCGSSSDPVVAKIAGVTTITKGQFSHWLSILAIAQYKLNPSAPVPKGAVSDSPSYAACASFLAHLQQNERPKQPQTKAQVAATCKQKYQTLKATTLKNLFFWYWLLGTGTALGIRPSPAEVRQQMKLTVSLLGPYERPPEETSADLLFRAKVEAIELKLFLEREAAVRKLPKTLTGKQREKVAIELGERWYPERQWISRTTCGTGYIVPGCSEYKGPAAPSG